MEINEVKQEDVDKLLEWANEISDKTGRSIAGIMARFSIANNELRDVEASKVRVANELINSKNKLWGAILYEDK